LALGFVLAIGAGALVYVTLQQQSEAAARLAREQARAEVQREIQTVPLPVAVRAIEPGRPLTAADFETKDFPIDLVPTSAVTSTADLENRILLRPVGEGETIQRSLLLGESGTALSQQIRPGFVLFAFPIVDLMGQSNLIADGDRIDLLLTVPPTTQPDGTTTARVSALTLQNIEVFKVLRPVDEEGNPGEATALLCSMKPEDAVMLKFIKDSGGAIDFALRSPLDVDPFTAPPVDDADLSERYLQRQ
jgi:pilus assembly protein CpaB